MAKYDTNCICQGHNKTVRAYKVEFNCRSTEPHASYSPIKNNYEVAVQSSGFSAVMNVLLIKLSL